jgi:anti-sigma factor (TIGR02949 family)
LSEISCEDVLHEIEHLVDGELDADQAAHLEHHISACGSCFGHADFRRKLKEIVRIKCQGTDDTPEHLLMAVRERLHAEGMGQHPPGPQPQA